MHVNEIQNITIKLKIVRRSFSEIALILSGGEEKGREEKRVGKCCEGKGRHSKGKGRKEKGVRKSREVQ